MTELMKNKKGLIMGVANDHSMAWGIAQALSAAGADLAFTYQGEAHERRVRPLAESLKSPLIIPCDVLDVSSMDNLFEKLKEQWGSIDFVVHAIAFSDKNELKGRYLDTTANNFSKTMQISAFSFTDICRRASELMTNGGSCLTLTYLGAEKYIPNYNVMGVAKAALEASLPYLAVDLGEKNIRVNAISAGPVRTLAASGIGDFRQMLDWNQLNAPLRKNVTIQDVGQTALYLLSDLSSTVTGEVIHVDAGYHVQGMILMDNSEEIKKLL